MVAAKLLLLFSPAALLHLAVLSFLFNARFVPGVEVNGVRLR
jgi:hypothetical protein